MPHSKWSDIRHEHIERIGREEFEAGNEEMLAEARGWRLAEIRRRAMCWTGTWRRSAVG